MELFRNTLNTVKQEIGVLQLYGALSYVCIAGSSIHSRLKSAAQVHEGHNVIKENKSSPTPHRRSFN